MGQNQSGAAEKDQKLMFSPDSQEKLKEMFLEASIGDEKVCLVKGLQDCLGRVLHSTIASRLCQQMHPDRAGKIDYQSFVFLANALFKATLDKRSALVETLARGDSDHVDILDLRHYVEKMVLSYTSVIKLQNRPKMDSLERLTAALLSEFSDKDASVPVTQADIESWLMRCPLFAAIQTNAFRAAFNLDIPHDYRNILPAAHGAAADYSPALGPLEQMFVNYALPQAQRDQWRLFFSNRIHGQSFSKLLGSITDQGPSLVVVRDTDGHVFGGYAPESWHCSGDFYGTAHTFLFSVKPKMEIFLPSGFNENYMYLNVNQQTLPNGLGFGGKFESLWPVSERRLRPRLHGSELHHVRHETALREEAVRHRHRGSVGRRPGAQEGRRRLATSKTQGGQAQHPGRGPGGCRHGGDGQGRPAQ